MEQTFSSKLLRFRSLGNQCYPVTEKVLTDRKAFHFGKRLVKVIASSTHFGALALILRF
jgi:hypothetical protein